MAAGRRIITVLGMGIAAVATLGMTAAAARADLRRCEDASGRITYSNEPCPTGTSKERSVDDRPAVEVPHDPGSDKAPHAGKVSNVVPSSSAAVPKNPQHAEEVEREQQKSIVARCDDLVRRIEYAQQDLLTAASSERASFELSLHRLQEEHEANCVTH